MMGCAERISRLTERSGLLGKLGVIGRQCWKIALNITSDVNIVRGLEIFREFQHQL
jgi:hypothetical protein